MYLNDEVIVDFLAQYAPDVTDDRQLVQEGAEATALMAYPAFRRCLSKIHADYGRQLDYVTATESDERKANQQRRYYSQMRLLVENLVATIQEEIDEGEQAFDRLEAEAKNESPETPEDNKPSVRRWRTKHRRIQEEADDANLEDAVISEE